MDLLAQMATFVRVVEANSLSGAARALRLSLPAVSRQLRALEQELGSPLLVRTTRRMALTATGQTFYEGAQRILRDVAEVRARAGGSTEVRGVLVVSAPVSIGISQLVPRIPSLAKAHPHLRVELRLEDRLVDFVREGVDVAIRGGALPPDSTAYIAHALSRFRRYAVASPAYCRKHGTPKAPEQLAGHACLLQLGTASAITRWTFEHREHTGLEREVAVTGTLSSSAPLALIEFAKAGLGVALAAEWLVDQELRRGALRRILPAWHSSLVSTWAIHRAEHRGSATIAAFVEAMRTPLTVPP